MADVTLKKYKQLTLKQLQDYHIFINMKAVVNVHLVEKGLVGCGEFLRELQKVMQL